jgi:hypothetical protein
VSRTQSAGTERPNVTVDESSYERRWKILAVLCTSLMVVIVGNTALNVALPTLARELDASISAQQWMVDAYGQTKVSPARFTQPPTWAVPQATKWPQSLVTRSCQACTSPLLLPAPSHFSRPVLSTEACLLATPTPLAQPLTPNYPRHRCRK